jgi:eukaryotic-like serine/threonine-protein kinase
MLLSLSSAVGVFTASDTGTLAYVSAEGTSAATLTWRRRDGTTEGTLLDPADYLSQPALSKDGTRAVVAMGDLASARDIWTVDVARSLRTRFTFGIGNKDSPALSHDGRSVYYSSSVKGPADIYRRSFDGSGEEELVLASSEGKFPSAVSPDGSWLVFVNSSKDTKIDAFAVPLTGERVARPFVKGPFTEYPCAFSPDGKWLAYGSNESGDYQVYVTSFPTPGRRWQVSGRLGGGYAFWSADGKEIVYHGSDGNLVAVPVEMKDGGLVFGVPKTLFKLDGAPAAGGAEYVPTSDHKRFLVRTRGMQASSSLDLVVNWPAEARR